MPAQAKPMLIGKSEKELFLLPQMANRHGLIAGATGTGKTITLQVIAENLSRNGVPVFLADVKGDLSGISQPGEEKPKILERLQKMKIAEYNFQGYPVTFWDIYGEEGHSVRTTISEMGPLLLSRLLNLNETQTGTLTLVFKIADDNGLLLLDMKDLRSMLQYVGDNSTQFTTEYGSVSKASIGTIQRGLLTLENEGGDRLFGEPAINLEDMIQVDENGYGVINILASGKLINSPKTYATFLLWLMSELFEQMPEVGDPEKPKIAFFFDEAHLLFEDAPKALEDKIEQVVRLIRSKGVGVFFISQNPLDIPEEILGQLGNRVQHALRAFTQRDQKSVKAAAQTFRENPKIDIEKAIMELGVGEALISFLDEKGRPGVVERALVCPPQSQIGPIDPEKRQAIIKDSVLYGHYEKTIDRESAYELLKGRAEAASQAAEELSEREEPKKTGRKRDTLMETVVKSAVRSMGSTMGRQIIRGVLGSIFGGRR
jgi:DNA helicase HerA-like ATPase